MKKFHRQPYELAALDLLANPSQYDSLPHLDERQIEYQLVVIPSFEPYRTWTVYKRNTGERLVRRVSWHQNHDYKIPFNRPTTFGADGCLSKTEGDDLSDNIYSITLPAFRSQPAFGIDGTTFGIRQISFCCGSELSWWCNPPEGWAELAAWYDKAIESFEAILPKQTEEW